MASAAGKELQVCSLDPRTGWSRDGYCRYRPEDGGKHTVCAVMTREFLDFTKARGNDLVTPRGAFPGLKEGDQWCICAGGFSEAAAAGADPPVVWDATHQKALEWKAVSDRRQN